MTGKPFEISFGDRRIVVLPGQTIAAALHAADVRSWRRTRSGGRPRGLFCGIGACHDCLISVNGGPAVRACLTEAAHGDEVTPPWTAMPGGSSKEEEPLAEVPVPVDVAVIGAGPAGMAAALAAARHGRQVTVVDAGARPGGQYHRQPAERLAAQLPGQVGADPTGRDVTGSVAGHPRITLRPDDAVWAAGPAPGGTVPGEGFALRLTSGGTLRARSVVLATGAHDLALPFPGWDLPGVMTAGGAQALVKGQLVRPGHRVVVAGTGPFLLPVAATLAEAGARVLGVFEANHPADWLTRLPAVAGQPGRLREAAHYLRVLRRHRVPVHYRHAVVAAHGDSEVEAVSVARLGPDWTIRPGSRRRLQVDTVATGYGFVASVELALALGCATTVDLAGTPIVVTDDDQRTTVAGVYAAGEVTGIGGAQLAAVEGELAGRAAADLAESGHRAKSGGLAMSGGGRPSPLTARTHLHRRRDRQRRFAAALAETYRIRPGWLSWLREDTLICRCEEVPVSRIRHAVDTLAVTDPRAAKLTCRAGLGMCQGRICAFPLAALLGAAGGAAVDPTPLAGRPIAVPVPLGTIAATTDPDPVTEEQS
ncbi:FAD-dependent oxidoreductase [Solwaraspora sp. WMMB335]|uniref:FAD-dependent oxidoreductase n=1 Tax=Solwaraspora sp. WMMB335 TaxID=3404118 RepID=UPI003B958194